MALVSVVRRSLALLPKRDQYLLAGVVAAQMVTSVLDLAAIILLGVVAGLAVADVQSSGSLGFASEFSTSLLGLSLPLGLLAGIAGGLLLGKSILNFVLTRWTYRFLAGRQAVVGEALASRFLSQSALGVRTQSSQSTAYALTVGVNAAVVDVIGPASVVLAETALIAVLTMGLLFIDPLVAVFSLAFFALVAAVLQMSAGRLAKRLGSEYTSLSVSSMETLRYSITAYREILVSGARDFFIQRFGSLRRATGSVYSSQAMIVQLGKYVFEISLVIGGGLLVLALTLATDLPSALATLTVFLLAAGRLFPSLLRIQSALITIRNSEGVSSSLFELLNDLEPDDESHSAPALIVEKTSPSSRRFSPEVSVSDVFLSYPGSPKPALSGVSLRVEPGESLAIVGPTGAGKTSLVDVMLGVHRPCAGDVRISGLAPLAAVTRWPGAIAYVPQNVALLEGTIRENVALGQRFAEIEDSRVWEVLAMVQLVEPFDTSGAGLQTRVGEDGVTLSGGQRQRLGIARALYSNPKLLIMDEATSSLDSATEAVISSTLEDLSGDVTRVVIAHRLATIRDFDRVAYLEEGVILGIGTFNEVRRMVPNFEYQAGLLGL